MRELLKRGETVANIERRIHVSKSFIKRMKAELKAEASERNSEETERDFEINKGRASVFQLPEAPADMLEMTLSPCSCQIF